MCFHSQLHKSPEEIAKRFHLNPHKLPSITNGVFNGFNFPTTPVIKKEEEHTLTNMQWGLIPEWSKSSEIQKFTLNAKIETLNEKPSFKEYVNQRCLVIVDGFFEWQWLDRKGKNKQKYLLHVKQNESFALGGIWSSWVDPYSGQSQETYAIITTEADELMSEIHNTKKRMPLVLNPKVENDWLNEAPLNDFLDLPNQLIAEKIGGQPTLFDGLL